MAIIYSIRKKTTGECYIGSTHGMPFGRWTEHVSRLRSGKHHSARLQAAWSGTTLQDWDFSILESEITEDTRAFREQHWFELWRPSLNGTSRISRVVNRSEMVKRVTLMLAAGCTYREIHKICGCSMGWITRFRQRATAWAQAVNP